MEGVSAIAERETESLVKQVALGQEPERQCSRKAWARKSKSRGRPGKGKKEFMNWGAAKKKLRIFISHVKFSGLVYCSVIFSILQQSSMQ